MDPVRFDYLSRTLVTAGSRRAVLGALLAGAGTALGLAGQPAIAQPSCLANRERCSDGSECCSGRCVRRNDGKKVCRKADNQGVCTVEQNICVTGSIACGTQSAGHACDCYETIKGHSFCGERRLFATCGCTSNAECERAEKGAKCIQLGPNCAPCQNGATTVCRTPCLDLDPVP